MRQRVFSREGMDWDGVRDRTRIYPHFHLPTTCLTWFLPPVSGWPPYLQYLRGRLPWHSIYPHCHLVPTCLWSTTPGICMATRPLLSAWPPPHIFPLPRLGDVLLVASILCIYAPPSTLGICMAFLLALPIYLHLQLPTTCLRRRLPLVSSWLPHLCYLHGVPTLAPSHVANELFSSFDFL